MFYKIIRLAVFVFSMYSYVHVWLNVVKSEQVELGNDAIDVFVIWCMDRLFVFYAN